MLTNNKDELICHTQHTTQDHLDMSEAQRAAKMAEAEGHMKEADKLAKTSFFKRKADWEGAAMFYERAANTYRTAKALDQAKEAFKKASNAQYQNTMCFAAAKALETAAGIAKDMKSMDEAGELYVQASNLYREAGNGIPGADNLIKAAKVYEDKDPAKSMDLLKQACELFEIEDKEHYSGDTFKQTISLLLKHKKYADTVQVLNAQCRMNIKLNQPHDLHKAYLSIIVIYLYCDDLVAAKNAWEKNTMDTPAFPMSQEGTSAAAILDAYEANDNDKLHAATQKQIFNFLDNQVARIAKQLKVTDSLVSSNVMGSPTPAGQFSSSSSSSTTTSTPQNEDDELL
eukprot:TRINITY_DN2122_c0_g1_i2.p1 TRINITY_DN2122_c0_g1~~TRINITY_DN2122_c0_g1_i2.p1  ORF type:complete len:343 (+),score=109.44 TRINITY_DN2122_c0_g1_i2:77-1105(+)